MTKNRILGRSLVWLPLALVLGAVPADAYRMIQNFTVGRVTAGAQVSCSATGGFAHWNVSNVDWHHNKANQGSDKAAALYNGMNVWGFVEGADHTFTYAGETTAGFTTDGINAVSWGTGQGCSTGCLALTALVLQSGQVIVESDITFNNAYTWRTDGNNYDTWTVAAHEFGHALGIHHTENDGGWTFLRPTMAAAYFGTAGRSLAGDDHAALQCSQNQYPPSSTCIPSGGVDDVLYDTHCCNWGPVATPYYCIDSGDYGTTWDSCYQVCGTPEVNGCIPSGGVDDVLYVTHCCSGQIVPNSYRCLDPADYGTDWTTCIQTCL